MAKITNLDDFQVYQSAMEIGEEIWKIVNDWDNFNKNTIGKQFVKSADSIAANLSEGYGRFFFKENKQFCYYSRGSAFETITWLKKSHSRGLINDVEFEILQKDITTLIAKVNKYINSIGIKNEN